MSLGKEEIIKEIRNETELGKELLEIETDYYLSLLKVKGTECNNGNKI